MTNSLGVLIYGTCTFLLGLLWTLKDRLSGTELFFTPEGILGSVGVGVSFSLTTLFLFFAFGFGAPLSVASPLVRAGGLILASFYGLLVQGEPVSLRYLLGMGLTFSGIYLVITR